MWEKAVQAWNYLSIIDLVAIGVIVFAAYKKGWPWVSAKIGSVFTASSSAAARLEALEVAVFGVKQSATQVVSPVVPVPTAASLAALRQAQNQSAVSAVEVK